MSTEPAFRTLSLGAGVQSTAVALLAAEGAIPTFDVAIFADTGWEPKAVYRHLDKLEAEVLRPAGIPLARVSSGNIRADALDPAHRFASMPLFVKGRRREIPSISPCTAPECEWTIYNVRVMELLPDAPAPWPQELHDLTANKPAPCGACKNRGWTPTGENLVIQDPDGMARRQCTSEYKLKPIKQEVRRRLGYVHPVQVPRGVYVEQAIGISTDEIGRARDSGIGYLKSVFPLLDLGMSRTDCVDYLDSRGWTSVEKSACIGCPYHGNAQWRFIRDHTPDEWADAVEFDDAIREGSARANEMGHELRGQMFLHRSRVPLSEAPIDHVTRGEKRQAQITIEDAIDEQLAEDGDPDGCSPWTCRSGEAVA